MADIRPQLAMLLGKEAKDIVNIRKTSEVPPRVSVIDVTMAITGKNRNHAAEDLRLIQGVVLNFNGRNGCRFLIGLLSQLPRKSYKNSK